MTNSDLSGSERAGLWKTIKDITYNEAHLAILGLYAGFVAIRPKPRHKPIDRLNWKNNKWYWKGAYVVGYLLKVSLVATGLISGKIPLPV